MPRRAIRTACRDCGGKKTLAMFATYRVNGEMRRRGICWECHDRLQRQDAEKNREYRREYRRQYNIGNRARRSAESLHRRRELAAYVNAMKNMPCKDCGVRWPPVAMDFDHVRGAKWKSVANLVSGAYKIDLVAKEIKKCDVVCACCHRLRTARRKENFSGKHAGRLLVLAKIRRTA